MFTRCINVRNVNDALPMGLAWLKNRGEAQPSRNGPVMVSPDPVVTCYQRPTERVLFSPIRDANPFFHFMEGLWMLAGRNEVEWISKFNSRFGEYSDDGATFWGAYGHRWRHWFEHDQLHWIVKQLRADPGTRRAVLTMWDGAKDPQRLDTGSAKDVPCNTNVFFRIHNGKLNMMVNNRSNDIIWGAYGANAVHMSMMQEFVAAAVGVGVGSYWQNSWNFHAYTDVYPMDGWDRLGADCAAHNLYVQGLVKPGEMVSVEADQWLVELEDFIMYGDSNDATGFSDPFFTDVAKPMDQAWWLHKKKSYTEAIGVANTITHHDWRQAAVMWLTRRAEAVRRKEVASGQE